MQIRTFSLNLGTSINKQLNIPQKDLFKRNENIIKIIFSKSFTKTLRSNLKKPEKK